MISVTVTKLPCQCEEQSDGSVECNSACISGSDISDSLIETEEVARSRGQTEIYENYSSRMSIQGSIPLAAYIKPRTTVLYTDPESGEFICKVTASSISIKQSAKGEYTADLNLRMERDV